MNDVQALEDFLQIVDWADEKQLDHIHRIIQQIETGWCDIVLESGLYDKIQAYAPRPKAFAINQYLWVIRRPNLILLTDGKLTSFAMFDPRFPDPFNIHRVYVNPDVWLKIALAYFEEENVRVPPVSSNRSSVYSFLSRNPDQAHIIKEKLDE